MAHSYTAEDKARALAMIKVNDGNSLKTSRELGIPNATLVYWQRQENEGKQSTMVTQLQQRYIQVEFAKAASRVRTKAMERLEQALDDPDAKFTLTQLATTVGILTDKLDRAYTLTQTLTTVSDGEQVNAGDQAKELTAFLNDNAEEAVDRRNVIDAEIEQPDKGLEEGV